MMDKFVKSHIADVKGSKMKKAIKSLPSGLQDKIRYVVANEEEVPHTSATR